MFMIFIFLALVVPTAGKSFLPQVDIQAEVEATLMAEFAGTFRPGARKDNILEHEAALRPMYNAVPQEANGTLHHSVVRYVLHRFFAQRGWFIRGLEPGTGAQNSSSRGDSLQGLQEWVPTFLQNFLEQLVGGRGLSLRELAILAATLEDLVHKESITRLEQAFHALELPLSAKLTEEEIPWVLEVFMMTYMGNGNVPSLGENSNREDVHAAHDNFIEHVPNWKRTQKWMRSVRQKVHPSIATLDFNAMSSIAEEIGSTFATFNKKECIGLKADLLDAESQKPGRVRLVDFYKKGLHGAFGFSEKIEYLRVLGALDETDPKQPHVIVPNYVSSRPNCLEVSQYYVVCCNNECEDLMGKLENSIASEMAAPEQIIPLVSAIASSTVSAPRALSAALTRRLHSIAESNAGQVPLHGRLFAQWMHHAFPRECPFPHEDGSTNPETPDEWMQRSGDESSESSEEEMQAHIDLDIEEKPKGAEARKHHHSEEIELPWSEVEELFNGRGRSERNQPRSSLRTISVLTVLCSIASGLVWASKPLLSSVEGQKSSLDFSSGKLQLGKMV